MHESFQLTRLLVDMRSFSDCFTVNSLYSRNGTYQCEISSTSIRSYDLLSMSLNLDPLRNVELQTCQPQKFLHPCNSFCILLQSSRYPRTRTSLFRETWLALPVPNPCFTVDLGLTISPTEVSGNSSYYPEVAARYSRSSHNQIAVVARVGCFLR